MPALYLGFSSFDFHMETSHPANFAHDDDDDDDKKDNNVKLQQLSVSVQYVPLTMVQDCMERSSYSPFQAT